MSESLEKYPEILEGYIFPKIINRNTILLLGAGASVTAKYQFLSWRIIKEYSQHIGVESWTDNLVDFVDSISANDAYNRRDFDNFVQRMLEKLEPTETHKLIASLPWREIITTNLDLVIEKAFDRIKNTPLENLQIKPILEVKDENYRPSNDEVRYVKLHGCISSPEKYPFIFSKSDFERATTFYKRVLSQLKFLSTDIVLLAIGYSFSDDFARHLLEKFDNYARAGRRPMYLVDPFIKDIQIPLFDQKGIKIIKMDTEAFFTRFQKWQNEQAEDIAKRKRISYFDVAQQKINPSPYVLRSLGNDLRPLNFNHNSHYVKPEDFYRGDEPSFDVIRQDLDVVRTDLLNTCLNKTQAILNNTKIFVPIILFKGSFGIGKSTFLYRFVAEALKKQDWGAVAFEIGDPTRISIKSLEDLFSHTKAKTVFLVLERIETATSYRAFRQFQAALSMGQFTQVKVILMSSIRENILEKFKLNSALQDSHEIGIDLALSRKEVENLVRKLEDYKLLTCRDTLERNEVINKILSEFDGDLLVTLYSLLSESHHDRILRNAIAQLSETAQGALLFIALLYQYQIQMPSGFLRSLLGLEWIDFGQQVIDTDFKGFVKKEVLDHPGLEPDTYLRIRHRRIAEIIVNMFYPSEDNRFDAYREIINKLEVNFTSSNILTDLLKAIRQNRHLSQPKINKLFDIASTKFYTDSHFVLHYTMNLERRGTKKDLEKGIEEVISVTSALNDLQNDRLSHRRAVLTAELGKLVYRENLEAYQALGYFNTARIHFDRKLILDPQSHYSYENYLLFEIWCLEHINYSPDEEMRMRIKIEEMFEQAENLITTNLNKIQEIKVRYHKQVYGSSKNDFKYLKFLDEKSQDPRERPLALVLKYYYYLEKKNLGECYNLIPELEALTEYDSVVIVLFRHYGSMLHNPNIRQTLLEFLRKHRQIETRQPIRYHFYQSIIQAYNRRFSDAYEHNRILIEQFHHFGSDLKDVWRDSKSDAPQIFEAIVNKTKGRYYARIIDFQKAFPLKFSSLNSEARHNDYCLVELYFYPYGIKALLKDIVKSED